MITRYVTALFEAMRVDAMITMEVHNLAAFENAFCCPTWHIESAPLFADYFAPLLRGQKVVAVSPEADGAKRAERFRQAFEQAIEDDVGSAYMEQYRDSEVVTGDMAGRSVRRCGPAIPLTSPHCCP